MDHRAIKAFRRLVWRLAPPPLLRRSSFTPLPGLASVLAAGKEKPRQYREESLGDWAYIYSREGVTTVNSNYIFI